MKTLAFLLVGVLFSTSSTLLQAQAVNSQDRDIGNVAVAGSASNNGSGAFTINASGADIWGTADEFHYLYFTLDGDMELIARVTGVQFTDGWAKAGLMARESLDANSRNIMVFVIPQNYSGFQWRSVTGGNSTYTPGGAITFPSWLKLVRSGNTFTGYESEDGDNWTLIGSTTVALPTTLYVGLAVTSHHDGTLCTATFDNVTQNSGGNGAILPPAPTNLAAAPSGTNQIVLTWTDTSASENSFTVERSTDGVNFQVVAVLNANSTTYTDTGLRSGVQYLYRVFASNSAGNSPYSNVASAATYPGPQPSGFQGQDIGAVAAPGRFTSSSDYVTAWGSGEDIYGTSDEFFFVYTPMTGDFTAIVEAAHLDGTNPWAKAGLMARANLNANSPNFMAFRNPAGDAGTQYRSVAGGNTTYVPGGSAQLGEWFKLTRQGNTFTAYKSTEPGNFIPPSTHFDLIGSATISMPSTIYVGMPVTSHADGVLANAEFDRVTIFPAAGNTNGLPAAPTGLTATALSSSEIRLTWTDNSSNETSFPVARSTDGINFQSLVFLAANATSFVDTALSPSTHYWYKVWANNNAGFSPPSNVADATTGASGSPPPGWFDQDIGTVSAAGSFSQSGGTFTVGGSGSDIWGTADELYYAYQYATGNVQIVARVMGMANTSPWAKAGVMIRASVAPGSQHVILVLTPGNGLAFQWRSTTDGPSSYLDAGPASAPVWVKLIKTGDTFTGYRSADGVNWTQVGSVNISMPSAIVTAGLPVTSDNDGTVCLANFENVSITSGGSGTPGVPTAPSNLKATPLAPDEIQLTWTDNATNEDYFRVERSTDGVNFQPLNLHPPSGYTAMYDSGLTPSTHYWYRIYAVNSAGDSPPSNVAEATTPSRPPSSNWRDQDIGAVGAAGSFSQSGNTFTVGGSGYDIWDNNDEFHYAYQVGSGTNQIVARITGVANTSPWAKAGVMIRQSLLPNAANVLLALTPSHGLAFQWRSAFGGQTTYIDAGAASGPIWVKLVQTADTVTGYRSNDGNSWTQIASVTIDASSSDMLAGLAVTSHFDGTVCTGNFDNVTITTVGSGGTTGVPAAPTGLTATATSSNNISLHWQDNANNETGFILERSTNGTSFIQIGTFAVNNQTAIEVVNPGTHHWYRVAATNSAGISPWSNVAEATTPGGTGNGGSLPAPWQSQNVGSVGVGGSASASQGTFTVKGSGADIWGTSDAFYFVYQTANPQASPTGNGDLIARVTGLQNSDAWAKAGIMFRQVLSANFANVGNAKNVFVMATPEHGTGIQSRSATSGGSSYLPGPFFTAPVWLRLNRQGDVFTGYSSLDGVNWSLIGSQTVTFDSPVVVGLAVTSHNNAVLNTATFDNVTWTPSP